jgi:hypothetical protein
VRSGLALPRPEAVHVFLAAQERYWYSCTATCCAVELWLVIEGIYWLVCRTCELSLFNEHGMYHQQVQLQGAVPLLSGLEGALHVRLCTDTDDHDVSCQSVSEC